MRTEFNHFAKSNLAFHRPGKPQTILIGDDERHIVRLLQVNLERQRFQALCAMTAQEALELLDLHRTQIDLAILDGREPGFDAYPVIESIRTHNETRSTRIVLMIHKGKEADWGKRPHKADQYVSIPFNPTDLFGP